MYDLQAIIERNNQAAIDYMMQGRAVDVAQSPQPKAWSLSLLAKKLQVGPPLLTELLDAFTNYNTLAGFLELVRKFLPEHESEILSSSGGERTYKFCYFFGKKYFPLPVDASRVNVEDLLQGLPVALMAMSYSAYHDLEMRPGYLLLLSLVPYPYEGDERDLEGEEPGGRVPLLDKVQRIVGEDIVRQIPNDGWHPSDLKRMTDGAPYDGVGHFAAWAWSETGHVVLDSSYENCDFVEGAGDPLFKWTEENVRVLTEQWPKVQEYRAKIDHIVEWLESNPETRFRELVEFLIAMTKKLKVERPKSRSYDPWDHMCPLDQRYQDEEED